MRALIHSTFGDPTEVLEVAERPLPEPGPGRGARAHRALADPQPRPLDDPRHVRVQARAALRQRHRSGGVVDALGEGVDGLKVGAARQPAAPSGCGRSTSSRRRPGSSPVPDGIATRPRRSWSRCRSARSPCSNSLDLKPGDWIVQNTANGAVGKLVAQFAPARGIHVLGLVRRDAGIAELAALGIQQGRLHRERRLARAHAARSSTAPSRARRSTRSEARRPANCCRCSAKAGPSCRSARWAPACCRSRRAT